MEKTKSIPGWLIKICISLGIAFFIILFTQESFIPLQPLKELEQKQIDERFLHRGVKNIQDSATVIILDLNNQTLQGLPEGFNKWPFPRSFFAKVLRNLTQAGVKAIGIDVVMSSEDRYSSKNDSILFQTIHELKNVVVAGKIQNSIGFELKKEFENYENVFYTADSSLGLVNVVGDNDGVNRRYVPKMKMASEEKMIPTFGFAVLNKYFGLPKRYVVDITDDNFLLGGKREIPKFDNVGMLINYYGPDHTFQHLNFLDILDDAEFKTRDEIDLETDINSWDDTTYNELRHGPSGLKYSGIFKNKIVLIGSTEPEDKDILPISFARGEKKGDNLIYGVELHANAVQNVIWKDFISKETAAQEIVAIIILTFLSFFFSSFLKGRKTRFGIFLELGNLLVLFLVLYLLRAFAFYCFEQLSFNINIIAPILALVFGYFGSTAYHFINERKQKAVIKGMFSQYVNSTVVDDLIADPDKMRLGGERKVLSIFFSDIAGFSTFSETKKPEELVAFLNEYLSEMTRIVFENGGTLDKYIGDAVMAFWGAPLPIENHAFQTCKSALLMQKRLAELRAKWRAEGQTEISVRMGINTGEVVVGNMGGSERFDYTVMGDTVNLASRLEGANKEYGTYAMVSESTYEIVKDDFIMRELDALVVKGKTKPVIVYELIALKDEQLDQSFLDSLAVFNEGLALYKAFQFKEAATKFAEAKNINSNDHPSFVYLKRCMHFIEFPPPKDWDGVFRMTTK